MTDEIHNHFEHRQTIPANMWLLEAYRKLTHSAEIRDMVLASIITVESTIATDNPDFLAGSQLDQPGVAGVYTIWAASSAADTQISITLGGRTLTNAAIVVFRANSEIRENEDTFFQMLSATGGRPVINVNIIAAATVRIRVKFLPAFAV